MKFNHDSENNTQHILYHALESKDTEARNAQLLQIVEKMYAAKVYEFDTVVTFIFGEYRKAIKKRDPESEEGGNDNVYANTFLLSSLNKTTQPKTAMVFDYIEKEFKTHNEVDPIINLTAPLSGFLFPAFNDNMQDVNHILYCAGKVNEPDTVFIEDVLNCTEVITAAEDKDCF